MELRDNGRLSISDQGCLVVPVEVIYRRSKEFLKVEIPLNLRETKN